MGGQTISGTLLNAAAATGLSPAIIFQSARNGHTMQVKLGGTAPPTTCVVTLQGTLDLVNYAKIATWDLSGGQVDGDILVVQNPGIIGVKASLDTLGGGTAPTVTVNYVGTDS